MPNAVLLPSRVKETIIPWMETPLLEGVSEKHFIRFKTGKAYLHETDWKKARANRSQDHENVVPSVY